MKQKRDNHMQLNHHIFLIGFMGCGKSTNAACLARITGASVMEMDEAIAKEQGRPIAEIFSAEGEGYFRDLETALLKRLEEQSPMIVSCGGGAVLREENVVLMKEKGRIVLLTAEPETIYTRVKDSLARPLLNGHMDVEYIRGLMEARRLCYEKAADITVSTDGKTAEEICLEILSACSL